jgi:hypothetical protein
MKRVRKHKPKKERTDLFGGWVDVSQHPFNKETNKPPFVPTLGIYKGSLVEIVRMADTKGEARIQRFNSTQVLKVKGKRVKRIPKGVRLTIWEFTYNRKWYIENHYAAGNKEAALFELNLYLKFIEKQILKKYGK